MKLYTIADLQELLSVSRITLLAWLDEGRFPSAYKDGEGVTSKWLIPAEDVKAIRKQRIADLDRRIGRLFTLRRKLEEKNI